MDDNKFDMLLKELKEIFVKIDDRFDKIDKKFEQIDKRFEQIEKRLDQIEKRLDLLEKRLDLLERKVDTLSNELGALTRTFFKFETDTRNNFDLLFEANQNHSDKELLFEKQLCRLHDNLDNTNFRVSLLENSAVNS